jgi:hypothetical protein
VWNAHSRLQLIPEFQALSGDHLPRAPRSESTALDWPNVQRYARFGRNEIRLRNRPAVQSTRRRRDRLLAHRRGNHPSSTAINNLFNTGSRGVFLGVVTNLPCWRC